MRYFSVFILAMLLVSCAGNDRSTEAIPVEPWTFDTVTLDLKENDSVRVPDDVQPDTTISGDGRLMFICWRPNTSAVAPEWGNICIWQADGVTYREWSRAQGFETRDYAGKNYWEGCRVLSIHPLKTHSGETRYLLLTYHREWMSLGYAQAQVLEIDGKHIYATRTFPDYDTHQPDTLYPRIGFEFSLGAWSYSRFKEGWLMRYCPESWQLHVAITADRFFEPDPVVTKRYAIYQWQDSAFVYIGEDKR